MIHGAPLLFFANLKGATDERATKFAAGAGVLCSFQARRCHSGALNTLADDVGWFLPGPKKFFRLWEALRAPLRSAKSGSTRHD
jgi:hypothetical protein